MAQSTNAQAIRLCDSIEKNVGKADAEDFATKFPLSKFANFQRKFIWANDICKYLEDKYSPQEIKKIRIDCSCNPSKKEMENTRWLYTEATDLDEFVENYNREYAGQHSIWYEGGELFFSYPACYCSCVKRVSETLPETWCLCTLGYTKKLFDYVFECDTAVELIESIKMGGNRCVVKITKG